MVARMKTEDIRAEDSLQQLHLPRAYAKSFRIWPRDVPKEGNRRLRQQLTYHLWRKREMIILDQHERRAVCRLGFHRVGEFPVDRAVGEPIGLAKCRPDVGEVTQGPQPFVGEAIIKSFLLFRSKPDAP